MHEVVKAANEAINREDYTLAANLLPGPAHSGILEAQFLLGYRYFTSADLDLRESRHWLELAAAQRHADALFHLSTLRHDGSTHFRRRSCPRYSNTKQHITRGEIIFQRGF